MKEKTLLKIALILIVILLCLYVISIVTYAEIPIEPNWFYNSSFDEEYYVQYILPDDYVTITTTAGSYAEMSNASLYYCVASDPVYFSGTTDTIRITEKYYELDTRNQTFLGMKNRTRGTFQYAISSQVSQMFVPGFGQHDPGYYVHEHKIINTSSKIMKFLYKKSNDGTVATVSNKYSTYESAYEALLNKPKIDLILKEDNTYLAYDNNSVKFNIEGVNLPNGSLHIYLNKIVDEVKTRVGTVYSEVLDGEINTINTEKNCVPLELGSYELETFYTYTDVETGLQLVLFDSDLFEINNNESGIYSVSLGGNIITVDKYFNRIWQIDRPTSNLMYNVTPTLKVIGNNNYLKKQGILQIWGYDNFEYFNEVDTGISYGLGKVVSVWLNDTYLYDMEFGNVSDLIFNINIPESKLNRGLNTIYITSYTGREIATDLINFERNGSYHYLFSGLDFYYKTSDVPNNGGGGGDYPYDDGIDIGNPPNRANYQSGLYGDIQFALDYIVYLIKIPFKVIFGGLGWLVNNFTNMFSWVGSLTTMIGTWFGFLPSEIRLLILGVIVCSFVGFAISIFKK